MFNKLARIDAGRQILPTPARLHHNDNRPDAHRAAAPRSARPQRLACHWRREATNGRLECFWQLEPADEVSAEAPGPSLVTTDFMITTAFSAGAGNAVTRRWTDGRAA
jgi:hypothetical protein